MGKKIRVIWVYMLVLWAFATQVMSTAYASPAITGVTGTFSDGQTVTLSGSGFGSNIAVGTSNIEFVGGANGPIESGTVGSTFTRNNWSIMTDWGGNIVYSNNSVPYRSKVLQMTSGSSVIEAPLSYKLPSAVPSGDHIYVSWWENTTWTGNGQYKILRFSPTNTVIDSIGQQDVYFFHNNPGGVTFGIDGGPYALYPSFSPAFPQSTWTRTDVDITTSSSNTGTITTTKYTPGSSLQSTSATQYTTQASGVSWNYIIWQNYFGTDGVGTMTAGDVWLDDLFIQHGSPARVELCDSSTWSSRQTCMIQPPTLWGNTISVTLNQGIFANGSTAYLYVIDANGNVSNGQKITFVSSTTSVPQPPTNLSAKVQ